MTTEAKIKAKPFIMTNDGNGFIRIWEVVGLKERLPGEPGVFEIAMKDVDENNSTTIRSDDLDTIYATAATLAQAQIARRASRLAWDSHQQTIASIEMTLANAKNNQWLDCKTVTRLIAEAAI